MSGQFDWQFDDKPDKRSPRESGIRIQGVFRFWLLAILILLLLGAALAGMQARLNRETAATRTSVQALLDEMTAACAAGDGERFFATQSDDPAWRATQLHPSQAAIFCRDQSVTGIELDGEQVRANVTWREEDGTWQRLAFFRAGPSGLVQTPPPPADSGALLGSRHAWGSLVITESDDAFAEGIIRFVYDVVDKTCSTGSCRPEARPFTLTIRPDYRLTADPQQIYLPSPRLLALDEDGLPGEPFWNQLEQRLVSHLTPGTIRFAVPSILEQVIDFEQAAADFMRQNRGVTVEIVPVALSPEQPDSSLFQYDGAAFTPDIAMLATGSVLDLTDYASTDPQFDSADFYEQVWNGGWWRDRLWLFPQAGQLRLLFHDCCVYEAAGLAEPSLHWTWAELERDISLMLAQGPQDPAGAWQGRYGLADATTDLLYAYAYNQQVECAGLVPATCQVPLRSADVAAALAWYQAMTVDRQLMPPVAGLPPSERTAFLVNHQAVRRDAAIWVDDAVNYEYQTQNARVGVQPFPGTDRFEGVTPVRVHGSFISATSARPRDVWRWLRFLSYQPLNGPLRYVPARPSVAAQMQYWDRLPGPLRDSLRAAFPFARPVTVEDERRFWREQLAAIETGEITPVEAARLSRPLSWFDR